ncbi:Sigma factor RpoE regulatory protein RseC [Marinobacterium lacunae]|uniref:Sigma factor RpoE regulatory protein RseC n=1 Tax=Marinobacterium lacunae TaxID=1232683 RepID=A0A081G473_9GAMM|nr:SoxR reducing system RseC family protein [Marinobacterium lacunae]KEA65578.1 Sigma factor RpoE regulatory protein RseC [Marinobacterium lacunae]MBR9884070.1 SoxR reducing system RseC family protein [Oceanospirillales bacterium]
MIEEVVHVSRVEDDKIWIEASRQSACSACNAKKSCGQGALSDWMSGSSVELSVVNPAGLRPSIGQAVVVGLEEGSLIKASVLIYMVPLLALVCFALFARVFGASEGQQIVAAVAGLAVSFPAVRWYTSRASDGDCYQPVLLRLA